MMEIKLGKIHQNPELKEKQMSKKKVKETVKIAEEYSKTEEVLTKSYKCSRCSKISKYAMFQFEDKLAFCPHCFKELLLSNCGTLTEVKVDKV